MPLWIAVVLLGIVEGITEFLPVSSTGHLLIAEHWMPRQSDLFNIVIQAGAVLAVLPLFPDRLRQFVFRWRESATQDYLAKLLVPVVITGAVGYVLDKKDFKLPEHLLPVAIALFVGGILFVAAEGWLRGKQQGDQVTWTIAIAVGVAQLIAGVFPGTSRSGATILIALVLGLNRIAATEFTFLVGIPTMLGVSGWKIFKAVHHPPPGTVPENWGIVLLGFIVSAAVSFVSVKWLLQYIRTHTFVAFGWYRIGLAFLIGVWLFVAGESRPAAPQAQVFQQAHHTVAIN